MVHLTPFSCGYWHNFHPSPTGYVPLDLQPKIYYELYQKHSSKDVKIQLKAISLVKFHIQCLIVHSCSSISSIKRCMRSRMGGRRGLSTTLATTTEYLAKGLNEIAVENPTNLPFNLSTTGPNKDDIYLYVTIGVGLNSSSSIWWTQYSGWCCCILM